MLRFADDSAILGTGKNELDALNGIYQILVYGK